MRETVSHKALLAAQQTATTERLSDNRHIPSSPVREICGGVSDMTLWRWLHDPTLAFPKPIYIGRRRYWREAEIFAWLEGQAAKAAD
jgi:predicted DNA-binding transcriptional regulator AlpA